MYTAIIAARPREKFLSEAIASIYNQTLQPESVVLVLNGDLQMVKADHAVIAAEFPKVTVVESSVKSMAHAFYVALELVRTRYVAFLDSDDTWFPDKQRCQVELLESSKDLDAVCGLTEQYKWQPTGMGLRAAPAFGRIFGAVTFSRLTFTRFGMPDPAAEHFTWLLRWWAMAGSKGISLARHEDLVLRRRIHAANGWKREYVAGRRQLLQEVRRIHSIPDNR